MGISQISRQANEHEKRHQIGNPTAPFHMREVGSMRPIARFFLGNFHIFGFKMASSHKIGGVMFSGFPLFLLTLPPGRVYLDDFLA